MEGAEPKTKTKRIRHCYPRREVYHRWIHSPEYVYASDGCLVSGKFNYLRCQNIGKFTKDEDIKEMWNYHKQFIIAVIDRENKKICISTKYDKWYNELINSLPDDYEIFWCGGEIPTPNILSFTPEDKEVLCKEHLKYAVEFYVETMFRPFYSSLRGQLILHANIDNIHNRPIYRGLKYICYNGIKLFVKKYKIKKYSWFKESLNPKFKFSAYWHSSLHMITIELPSIKKVLNDTVFTKREKEYFRKRYFYTEHCFGRGIPFSDVDKYFGTSITHDEAVRYCNKRNIYLNTDWLVDVHTWNELISKTHEIERKIHNNYVAKQVAKSEANYNAALEELRQLESNYTVNSWREGKVNTGQHSVSYRKYSAPSRYNSSGTWMTAAVHSSCRTFTNTQLKLEGNIIRTSRNATVTLEEGIRMYKMFMIGRNNNPNRTSWTTSDFGNVKVGIYNLRFITYKDKVSDSGKSLGYKEWCIQIGCHSLWLDDVEDFIKYYHLEDKFHYNTTTKKNN